jgi:tRNA threonylcarbamoyladenosine biosynthesis protein TsaB
LSRPINGEDQVSIPAEPRVLVIETSSRAGQVAIAQGNALLAVRRLDEARRHARDLAPSVSELLTAQGWKARDLNAVLVSRGPGSYTGLRVGVVSAKILAYATGCVLLGIDTFAALALQAPAEASRLDVLADAQQGKVYIQSFARTAEDSWQALTPLAIRPLDEWLAQREPTAWASGPGLHTIARRLPATLPLTPGSTWDPRAESLLRLGMARYRAGEQDDAWTLEPLYLRPSAAEQQWTRH